MPQLSDGSEPLYLRLATSIEDGIQAGLLPAGAKLPPQRDLAYDLGVTVGTVGRAYALVRERGLVSGEVGRGTYVTGAIHAHAGDGATEPMDGTRFHDAPADRIRFDSTAASEVGQSTVVADFLARICAENGAEIAGYSRQFPPHWFEAGAAWLGRSGLVCDPANIVPTLGVHAGIMSIVGAMSAPGDGIVYEELTYSQVARATSLIGRRTLLCPGDGDGLEPEAFERVCAQRHPRLAFLMPTAQNPTLVTMPLERRRRIVEIARRHNVFLIEDDLYGSLTDDETPLVAQLAPERTFLANGLSKSVAAGVRGGWVMCPPGLAPRVQVAHKMLTGGMPFLLAELCARLVLSGEARGIRERTIAETNSRLDVARRHLAGYDLAMRANIPFIWVGLPDPWLSSTFKNAAYERGVLIDDEDEFKPGRTDSTFHRVRLGISVPRSIDTVEQALTTVACLMEEGGAGYDTFG